MATISLHGGSADFLRSSPAGFPTARRSSNGDHGIRSSRYVAVGTSAPAKMKNLCSSHAERQTRTDVEDGSEYLHIASGPEIISDRSTDLQFNKLQQQYTQDKSRLKRVFGRFMAREAILDEEYWTAAWLRAETQYEGQSHTRYVDSYKRKFAEQEFNDLKRSCMGQLKQKCTCIVAVKEDKGAVRTVLNSVVGTLDLSIRHVFPGESFPGEHMKKPGIQHIYKRDAKKYGYIANLCVAKFARRQGIASNMLYLAIEEANASGVNEVFVRVDRNNKPAQNLYKKVGFQIVETATPNLLADQQYLLCFNAVHNA